MVEAEGFGLHKFLRNLCLNRPKGDSMEPPNLPQEQISYDYFHKYVIYLWVCSQIYNNWLFKCDIIQLSII